MSVKEINPKERISNVTQMKIICTNYGNVRMECEVYMGVEDIERQKLNVFRMELLGAKVIPVTTGTGTLKDATNEAIRTWVARAEDTFYIIGSAVGPHPYPTMVRDFQRIIGDETRKQVLEKEGRLPDRVFACVGGGSNSIGMFYPFVEDKSVELVGVEAAGHVHVIFGHGDALKVAAVMIVVALAGVKRLLSFI